MTEQPRYGVVTCGKPAPAPFTPLGGCIHEPGHDGKCRFKPPQIPLTGYLEVGEVTEYESPLDTDEVIVKYRAFLKRQTRISLVCTIVVFLCSVWSLLSVFDIV